jgi:hypothetical protein
MRSEQFLSELATSLQLRGLESPRVNELVSETESHLLESGEDPLEAFGEPDAYAERLVSRDENQAAPPRGGQYVSRTLRASAIDEMHILRKMGRKGWELIDVGALALFCRRPRRIQDARAWKYKRRVGCHHVIIREEMIRQEWEPCGNWLPFHYFKRSTGPVRPKDW